MLEIICERLKEEIETLNIFSKRAGLVRTIERTVSKGVKNLELTEERYPVSCVVDGEKCWEQGMYKQLVPNSGESGTFYFEFLRGMRLFRSEGGFLTYEGQVRLVQFVNIKKLNINNTEGQSCTIAFALRAKVGSKINGKRFSISHSLFRQPIQVWAVETNQPESSTDLFRNYSYEKEMGPFFFYPHEVFATDYTVYLQYAEGCINDIVAGTPIEC